MTILTKLNFSLHTSLTYDINAYCNMTNRTMSDVIRQLIYDFVYFKDNYNNKLNFSLSLDYSGRTNVMIPCELLSKFDSIIANRNRTTVINKLLKLYLSNKLNNMSNDKYKKCLSSFVSFINSNKAVKDLVMSDPQAAITYYLASGLTGE